MKAPSSEYGRNDPHPVDMKEHDRVKELSVQEILEEIRKATVQQLLLKVKAGEASAAELAVVRNLLRDNGIILGFDGVEEPPGGHGADGFGFQLPELPSNLDDEDE